jgi:hypothetical protein
MAVSSALDSKQSVYRDGRAQNAATNRNLPEGSTKTSRDLNTGAS